MLENTTTFQITEKVGKQFLVAFVLSDMSIFLAQMLLCLDSQIPLFVRPSRRYRIGLGLATAAPHDDDVAVWQMLSRNPALYFHAQLKLFLSVCERHIWNPPMSHLLVFWAQNLLGQV